MLTRLQQYAMFKEERLLRCEPFTVQGLSNHTYHLEGTQNRYVVHLYQNEKIDRTFEFKVHDLAYAQGLTSKPLLLDVENNVGISTFIEGKHVYALTPNQITLLATVLQRLHLISMESTPIKIENLLSSEDETDKKLIQKLHTFPLDAVLCHNDLNPNNLLFTQTAVKLIDWEYAGVHDRYFDLASVCVEFALSSTQEALFLTVYFKDNTSVNKKKLKVYKTFYEEVKKRWLLEND